MRKTGKDQSAYCKKGGQWKSVSETYQGQWKRKKEKRKQKGGKGMQRDAWTP